MKNNYRKQKVNIGVSTSGSIKYIDIYTITSPYKGLSVYIQANIHGPEIAGIPVALELVKYLKKNLKSGCVTIIPYANPWGIDTKFEGAQAGYINHNGEKYSNWNRIFPNLLKQSKSEGKVKALIHKYKNHSIKTKVAKAKSLLMELLHSSYIEKKKSYQLKKEDILIYELLKNSLNADIVIDLHTAGECIKHVYYFNHQQTSAMTFGIETLIELPYDHIGVFDESNIVNWSELIKAGYLKNYPIEAYTVELEGNGYSSSINLANDLCHVLSFLSHKGLIVGNVIQLPEYVSCKEAEHIHLYSHTGGIFHCKVKKGDKVKEGQLLGHIIKGNKKILIASPFNGIVYQLPNNYALETGQPFLGIFSNHKCLRCR